MIAAKHLAEALYNLSKEDLPTSAITRALFEYLEKHKLLSLLPATLRYLEGFEKDERKFNSLEIQSGLPIDDEVTDEIRKILAVKKDAQTKKEVNNNLIGGFVATYQSFIYDASLKSQLNLLKAKLIEY